MVILQDNREQMGLTFSIDNVLTAVEPYTLSVGDYACRFKDGTIPPVRFERKSLGDLFGTMTSGYPRFKRELVRAREEDVHLILIVECHLLSVLSGYKHSRFPGESMVQKLFTLMVRHRLPIVFCRNRDEMAAYIRGYFEAIGREYVAQARLKKAVSR